jgi:ankyrin repeat protein
MYALFLQSEFWRRVCHVQDGDTALIGAAAKGHTDCVRLLIDAGADKDVRTNVRVCHYNLSQLRVYFIFLFSPSLFHLD